MEEVLGMRDEQSAKAQTDVIDCCYRDVSAGGEERGRAVG